MVTWGTTQAFLLPKSLLFFCCEKKQPGSASGCFILYLLREKEMKENQACSATYKTSPPILKSSSSKGTNARCDKTANSRYTPLWTNADSLCSETTKPLLLKDTAFPMGLTRKFHTTGMARNNLSRAAAEYFGIHAPFSCKHPPFTLHAVYTPGQQWQQQWQQQQQR